MSFQYADKDFEKATPLPTFVLVDPRREHLRGCASLKRGDMAGIIIRCRTALRHARDTGMDVVFVRNADIAPSGEFGSWIRDLEPMRSDRVVERRGRSCYDNRYFDEVTRAASELVFAGFLGTGGCLATAADGLRIGRRLTFLRDGTIDAVSEPAFGSVLLRQVSKIHALRDQRHRDASVDHYNGNPRFVSRAKEKRCKIDKRSGGCVRPNADRLERVMRFDALETDECPMLCGIRDALALLEGITQGDLLAVLPDDEADAARHQTGLTLLELIERRLREVVGVPQGAISGECACQGNHCSPCGRE